jgi:hypothetical protein
VAVVRVLDAAGLHCNKPVWCGNQSAQEIWLPEQESALEKPRKCVRLAGFCLAEKGTGERKMFFGVILFVWAFVLDVTAVSRMTDDEEDLDILLLRQQLRIAERKQERGPQIPGWQKVPLIALVLRVIPKTGI